MLTKLEVENFKSFKCRTILDFESTNYKILRDINVTDDNVLKGAIFVGGNASGKTNVILALRVLLDLLFRERKINLAAYKCLFSKSTTMNLCYQFKVQGSKIDYYIEYDIKNRMLAEKLFVDAQLVLERIGETTISHITHVKHFKQDKETLALRTIYFNTGFQEYPILRTWFEYLTHSIYLDALLGTMNDQNTGYIGLKQYLDENGTDKINMFLKMYHFKYKIEYQDKRKESFMTLEHESEKTIFFKRQGISESIPFFMESLGNRNLLNILPAFFNVIENGGMLIIDDFSSAFHNELEALLVKFFMQQSREAQLFLVSHSTNLLSNAIFRPDQEYAVEFSEEEGSRINRFSNAKPREAQNIEKMYNEGAFGGVPLYNGL